MEISVRNSYKLVYLLIFVGTEHINNLATSSLYLRRQALFWSDYGRYSYILLGTIPTPYVPKICMHRYVPTIRTYDTKICTVGM